MRSFWFLLACLCLAGLWFGLFGASDPEPPKPDDAQWPALEPSLLTGSSPPDLSDRPAGAQVGPTKVPTARDPVPLETRVQFHRVHGSVVESQGAALAGAALLLMVHAYLDLEPRMEALARTESRADGSWEIRLEGPEWPERMAVIASAPGFATEYIEVARAEGDRTEVPVFTLRVGGAVEGRVLDEEGRPVAGARVFDQPFPGPREIQWTTATDAQGRYRLEGLPLGRRRLTAEAEGLLPVSSELESVPSHRPLRLDLRLERGLSISGRVLVSGGLPAVGARVRAARPGEAASQGRERATDEGGRFTLTGLVPGTFEVAADLHPLVARKRWVQAGESAVVLLLGPGGGVRGVALDPEGAPLALAVVECRLDSD